MQLPTELLDAQIMPGSVYYYSAPEYIITKVPHYFVCVSRSAQNAVFMVCCTTKINTVKKHIENNGFDYATMATIKPSQLNGLKEETYINCNTIHEKPITWLIEKAIAGEMSLKGQLEVEHYEQVLIGITKSELAEQELIQDCEGQLNNL